MTFDPKSHWIYRAGHESTRCEFCGYIPEWCQCDPEEPEEINNKEDNY